MADPQTTSQTDRIISAVHDRSLELIGYIEPAINGMTKDKSFRRILWMGVVEAAKLKVAENV